MGAGSRVCVLQCNLFFIFWKSLHTEVKSMVAVNSDQCMSANIIFFFSFFGNRFIQKWRAW